MYLAGLVLVVNITLAYFTKILGLEPADLDLGVPWEKRAHKKQTGDTGLRAVNFLIVSYCCAAFIQISFRVAAGPCSLLLLYTYIIFF